MLYTVLISSVILMIGLTILNITISQTALSGTSRGSQAAFYAANSSLECVLYWDLGFDDLYKTSGGNILCPTASPASIVTTKPTPPATWTYSIEMNLSNGTCADIVVLKDVDVVDSVTVVTSTTISSSGFNTTCPCNFTGVCGTDPRPSPFRLERGMRVVYSF